MSELSPERKERIGPALGKLASGIYVTTAIAADGRKIGMLASFVEQAAFTPPSVMLAIGSDRPILAAIREGSGIFGLNVMSKDNGALIGAFAKPRENPFDGLNLAENEYGVPQLTDAMAFLACKVTGSVEAGDHVVVVAEVLDGSLQQPEAQPMVRIRPNGFGY